MVLQRGICESKFIKYFFTFHIYLARWESVNSPSFIFRFSPAYYIIHIYWKNASPDIWHIYCKTTSSSRSSSRVTIFYFIPPLCVREKKNIFIYFPTESNGKTTRAPVCHGMEICFDEIQLLIPALRKISSDIKEVKPVQKKN